MSTHAFSRGHRGRALLALGSLGVSACAALVLHAAPAQAMPAGGCTPSGYSGAAVSQSDVLARANAWTDANQPYTQTCAHTTQGDYRQDCSGFVSMAWELASSPVTTQFNPEYHTDPQIQRITAAALVPGDALVRDDTGNPGDGAEHHIVLFTGWQAQDAGQHRYATIEEESTFGVGTIRNSVDLASSYWSLFIPIHYTGMQTQTGFKAVAEANTSQLWEWNGSSGGNDGLGMMAGTSPAIAAVPGGYQVAIQANSGDLYVSGAVPGGGNLHLGMKAGTSPAIAAVGTGYDVAFQANTGHLFIYSSATGQAVDTGQGMDPASSPTIASTGTGYEAAFQANNHTLYTETNGTPASTGQGMSAGTNPAITNLGTGYQLAFQANTGELITIGTAGGTRTGQGMKPGTSPAIATNGTAYEIAFQANTGNLYTFTNATTTNTGLGMNNTTSPAITAKNNGYEIAIQANTGNLYLTGAAGASAPTLGMHTNTNPAIA